MATPCDKQCDPCHTSKSEVYICLKSEGDFLASLLRLGLDERGRRNLLGYEPSELIDWYLYAKRSFEGWPSKDPFGWSIKLLDELGKFLFGLAQVTAKAPDTYPNPERRGRFLLLQPAEQRLLLSFIPPDFSVKPAQFRILDNSERCSRYDEQVAETRGECAQAAAILNGRNSVEGLRASYEDEFDCRIGFTMIQEVGAFFWQETETEVFLILRQQFDGERDDGMRNARLKLAGAYLHGVARFALYRPAPAAETHPAQATATRDLGYWIETRAPESVVEIANWLPNVTPTVRQEFAAIPRGLTTKVRLSCELAASFAEEFWRQFDPEPKPKQALFDVLFMCREEEAGWFWCLTKSQLDHLRTLWGPSDLVRLLRALDRFRFSHAGIINHLERTESLIEEVYDFREEQFICTVVGYHLERTRDVADDFKEFEEKLPGVLDGCYVYFRISSHVRHANQTKKVLPEGALVAIFRFDRTLAAAGRLRKLAAIRFLIERWRHKVDSLDRFTDSVRDLARPFQEKTARAAIMSRNLSHNVGSHALANPRLFEAIGVFNQLARPPSRSEEFDVLTFDHASPLREPPTDPRAKKLCEVCYQDLPVVGDVRRNMDGSAQFREETDLHGKPTGNVELIGRPVLQGEAWRARSRLGALNSYLQARLDFIARAVGEGSSQPEPMFFIDDLLKGFLGQTVLLNTLLSDNGYTANQLDFIVTIHTGQKISKIVFSDASQDHEIRHTTFKAIPSEFADVLVAIPGGMVGRHAFYALIENFVRNAAKYGAQSKAQAGDKAKERLEVYLTLQRARAAALPERDHSLACFVLTLHDNISADTKGDVANQVRGHLNEPMIDRDGQARIEGHGIQEMKVCAHFLAGGEKNALVFPTDANLDNGLGLGKAYSEYAAKKGVVKIEVQNSLICHLHPLPGEDSTPSEPVLAYSLLLQQPRLLGIVDYGEPALTRIEEARNEPTVVFYDTIETLSKNAAYFGIVRLDDPEKIEDVLNEIQGCHAALPFRLMIAARTDDEEINKLREIVVAFEEQHSLPVRRVKVVACADLFLVSRDSGASALRAVTLKTYDQWLKVFKGQCSPTTNELSAKWHLAIAFERPMGYVLPKWNLGSTDTIDLGFDPNSSQLQLSLIFQPQTADAPNCLSSREKQPLRRNFGVVERANMLVLDNHGICISGESEKAFGEPTSIPVYHPFSGGQQIDLFQLLDSPPTDPFARSFLIYAVAESLLTNVAVVDERVADACLMGAPPQAFGPDLREKQRARIFPILGIKTQGNERHPLSETARTAVDASGISEPEGLIFSANGSPPMIRSYSRLGGTLTEILLEGKDAPDVIIIHEGVTDTLHSKKPTSLWTKGDHLPLYQICPMVVRTSGRGSQSRHLGNELPFYEFSELSDAVYRQMNKVALVRGLFSLRGS